MRVVDYASSQEKEKMFLLKKWKNMFIRDQESFNDIPRFSDCVLVK